jgi:3-oxoacyl-[acyl-carrier protein] reductase
MATGRIRFLDETRARREARPVDGFAAEIAASIAVGRLGEPQEYADAVAFLANPRACDITGSTLRIDGGMIASI